MSNSKSSKGRTPTRIITVRTPEDVLAMVPFVLGFLPERSVVLITHGGAGQAFHARCDLPSDPADVSSVVEVFAGAAERNAAQRALLVYYSDAAAMVGLVDAALRLGLAEVGVDCGPSLRAFDGCYVELQAPDMAPVPYDVAGHPLSAQAVYEGRVTSGTREDLVASVAARNPASLPAFTELCDAALRRLAVGSVGPEGEGVEVDLRRGRLSAEARWARGRVRTSILEGAVLDDACCARLLAALTSIQVRDELWLRLVPDDAEEAVGFWRDVVQRAPTDFVAPAASLLAFAAWQAGNGALAWCALDRALAVEPDYSVAQLLATMLEAAMPPGSWRPFAGVPLDS